MTHTPPQMNALSVNGWINRKLLAREWEIQGEKKICNIMKENTFHFIVSILEAACLIWPLRGINLNSFHIRQPAQTNAQRIQKLNLG